MGIPVTTELAGAVIGVDAGGGKTHGVLVRGDGHVMGVVDEGPGNYQSVGAAAATRVYRAVIGNLVARAAKHGLTVGAAAYGLSGLDRPRDETNLRAILSAARGDTVPFDLVNDTDLVLRAGTVDGVGLAVVSGTGSNCVGRSPGGLRARIGGLAFEFGDDGGGHDIGVEGLRAAFRGEDGRGPPTALSGMLRARYGLERLDDLDELIDAFLPNADDPLAFGAVAPLVFGAAGEGDAVCRSILEHAGQELGLSARLLGTRLFGPDAEFPLVMGGAVLQRPSVSTMRDALLRELGREHPRAYPVKLDAPPVLGAALLALDRLAHASGGVVWPDVRVIETARLEIQRAFPIGE